MPLSGRRLEGGSKMKSRICMILVAMIATFAISAVAYADGSGGGSMMGGGGHGMMGGGGSGMMGYGQWVSALWEALSEKFGGGDQNNYEETETLRRQIREKRGELASLYSYKNTDKKLIDQKIDELNRLESELDARMFASD